MPEKKRRNGVSGLEPGNWANNWFLESDSSWNERGIQGLRARMESFNICPRSGLKVEAVFEISLNCYASLGESSG